MCSRFSWILLACVVILASTGPVASGQLMPGNFRAAEDPRLDLLIQQKAFLDDRVQLFESEIEMFPDIDAQNDPAIAGMQRELDALKKELTDVETKIAQREKELAVDDATQQSGTPSLLNGMSPLGTMPQFGETPPNLRSRSGLDRGLFVRLQEKLRQEAVLIQQRLATLRPDQEVLRDVLESQLTEITAQLSEINNEIGDMTGGATAMPGITPTAPGRIGIPPYSGPANPLQQMPMAMPTTAERIKLLDVATENLQQAGLNELAYQVILRRTELQMDLDQQNLNQQMMTSPGTIPGTIPGTPGPFELVPSGAAIPLTGETQTPPSIANPTATAVPPAVITPPAAAATPTTSPTDSEAKLRGEVDQMRGDIKQLNQQIQALLLQMQQNQAPLQN